MKILAISKSNGNVASLTILAVFETIVSSIVAIFIAVKLGVISYIFLSALVSLLFYLRTNHSITFGLRLFDKVKLFSNPENIGYIVSGVLLLSIRLSYWLIGVCFLIFIVGFPINWIIGRIEFELKPIILSLIHI